MDDVESANLKALNWALERIYNPATLCCICKHALDIHAPHAIVNHDYAHVACADASDSRDLGALPDPADLMGSERPDIDDEE